MELLTGAIASGAIEAVIDGNTADSILALVERYAGYLAIILSVFVSQVFSPWIKNRKLIPIISLGLSLIIMTMIMTLTGSRPESLRVAMAAVAFGALWLRARATVNYLGTKKKKDPTSPTETAKDAQQGSGDDPVPVDQYYGDDR